jgi:hypothetical protein
LQFFATAVDASTARVVGRISFILKIDAWIEGLDRMIDHEKPCALLIDPLKNRADSGQPSTCAGCVQKFWENKNRYCFAKCSPLWILSGFDVHSFLF